MSETKRSFFGFNYAAPGRPKKKKPTEPAATWQDREVLFDLPAELLRLRSGERLVDCLASVEDSKGGVLSKGTLMVTNLRFIFLETKQGRNMSVGLGCIVRATLRGVNTFTPAAEAGAEPPSLAASGTGATSNSGENGASSGPLLLQKSASALVIVARALDKARFEFVFAAPPAKTPPRTFRRLRLLVSSYESTRPYRDLIARGSNIVRKGSLVLLHHATAKAHAQKGSKDSSGEGNSDPSSTSTGGAVGGGAGGGGSGGNSALQQQPCPPGTEEEVFDTVGGVFNLSGTGESNSGGTLGTLVLTNVRVVWFAKHDPNYNVSVPHIAVKDGGVRIRTTKFGSVLSFSLGARGGNHSFGFRVDPLQRLEELTQQAAALHRTFSAAPLFGVALPVAPPASVTIAAAVAAASHEFGEDGDEESEIAARAEAAFSVRDGVVMANSSSVGGADMGGVATGGGGGAGLDPTAYFADPFKAQDRPVAFDEYLGLAVETPVAGYAPQELWNALLTY